MNRERKRRCWVALVIVLVVGIAILAIPEVGTRAVCGQGVCPPGYSNPGCSGAYKAGNCTCYAWRRAGGSDMWGKWFPDDLRNAYQWNENAQRFHNFRVGATPRPNAVAVWEENIWTKSGTRFTWGGGHVAYVESTQGDIFTVSHMNFCGQRGCLGCLTTSTFNVNDFRRGDLHFIYPPNAPPRLISPSFGEQIEYGGSATLGWQGGQGPYEVEIYVAVNASAPRSEAGLLSRVWGIEGTAVNLYDFEDPHAFYGRHTGWPNGYPLPLGTYYWKVKGSSTDWSEWQMFQLVDCRPGNSPYGSAEELESNLLVRFWNWVKSLFGVQAAEGVTFCPSRVPEPIPSAPGGPTSTPFPTPVPTWASQPTLAPTPEPTPNRSQCQDENRPGIYLYTDKNYGGACAYFTYSHSNLGNTPVGDNQASSIRIVGDYEWVRLYEHGDYEGRYTEINGDDLDLDNESLGEQYSSIKIKAVVSCGDESRPGVYVYSGPNFEGSCAYFMGGCHNLGDTPVGDNNARSIRLVGDYGAELFEDRDCRSRSDEFHQDERKLDDRSLGRQYSSVRVSCETTPTPTLMPTPTVAPAATPVQVLASPTPAPQPTSSLPPTPVSPPTPLPSDYNAADAGTTDKLKVDLRKNFAVTIKVRNTGTATWREEGGVRLSNISGGRISAPWELMLNPGEKVEPGEVRSWTVNITAPSGRGTYWLSWRMDRTGANQFFGEVLSTEIKVGAFADEYDAEDAGTLDEIHMRAGESVSVTIRVKNTGSAMAIWRADCGTWLHCISKGHMSTPYYLKLDPGEEVKPGEIRSWATTLTAPGEGWRGTYTVSWRMEECASYFFGDIITLKVYVE